MAKISIPFFNKSNKSKASKPPKAVKKKRSRPSGSKKGPMSVYTVLLGVAFIVLTTAVVMVGLRNIEHSSDREGGNGTLFQLVDTR